MVGDFGVGKTSLVARFVSGTFSERYLTTVGVKIDSKVVPLPNRSVKLVLWDLAGRDGLDALNRSYLRGAAGLILVADGTRAATLDTAHRLRMQIGIEIGALPAVLLVNKFDLFAQWEVEAARLAALRTELPVYETSAKTGEAVEAAFVDLAGRLP